MAVTDNMSAVVIAGVTAKWLATGSLSGIFGPYLDEKPSDKQVSTPYCVFNLMDAVDDGWTCLTKRWVTILEFAFHAATPEAANTSLNVFLAVFGADTLTLTLSNGSLTDHRVQGVSLANEQNPGMGLASCRIRFRSNHSRT